MSTTTMGGYEIRPIADGAYPGIRPICICGHYDWSHEDLRIGASGVALHSGPCHAIACDCRRFLGRPS